MWGNLAAFAISAGPMVAASLGGAVDAGIRRRARSSEPRRRTDDGVQIVLLLVAAAWVSIALADLSNMSRAEVERIWLPFVPWALLGLALFGRRARRIMLAVQIVFAIVVQSLVHTGW